MRALAAALVFFISVVASAPLNAATGIFDNGFESGNISGWAPHLSPGATFTAVTNPVAIGTYAGKFDLVRDLTKDTYRAETYLPDPKGYFIYEREYWFSFKFRYENWAKDSDSEIAPFQIHERPGDWNCTSSAVSIAPVLMLSQNDEMRIITYGGKVRWKAPLVKQRWYTVTVNIKPSKGSTGFVRAWIDGAQVVNVTGANQPATDRCGNPMRDPYFNMGVYKWNWKLGRPATQSSRRTLIVDALKVAEGSNGYDQVTTITGTPPIDSDPPIISNLSAAATATAATISWNTNEGATSKVEYGPTVAYGSSTTTASTYLTTHSRAITGLTQNTTYHYRVTSVDAAGNVKISTDQTFITPMADVTGPVLSNITVSGITPSGATITWTTNEASDSLVDYGTTTSYGQSNSNATMLTSHSATISGLSQNTLYNFRVTSKDASNNSTSSGNLTFTTAVLDATPPTVSSTTAASITGTSATITWTTNEASNSRVDYGTTIAYGNNRTATAFVTSHSINLIGLTPGTTYQYKASSKDTAGNNGSGPNLTFTTLDTVAPVLSSIAAETITETSATITWTTNEPTDGLVEYGLTSGYGLTKPSSALETSHSLNLTGLTPGSVYHFKVTSKDASLNSASSGDITFTTASPTDTDKPIISGVYVASVSNNGATIVWTTDENSDSRVDFGGSLSYGGVATKAAFVTAHSVDLTGLLQNTTYHFKVASTDGAGNTSDSLDFTFTTTNTDTIPPNISSVVVTPSTFGAGITWFTNEASDSSVDYGLTTAYGGNVSNSDLVTAHSITLTRLLEKTAYNYKIHSTDSSGNTGHSANITFTTLDSTAPTISNITVSATSTGAVVTWTTNEPANGRVDYGVTTSYGNAQSNATMATSHSILLEGLSENEAYHYKITSVDAVGNSKESADLIFATLDQTAPVISNVVCATTSNTLRCTWDTNERADTKIKFVSPISSGPSTTPLVTAHELTVNGLLPNTAYVYKIIATDQAGNVTNTSNYTLSTSGPLTPNISSISDSIVGYGAFTVGWLTDIAANSKVEYGLSSSYGAVELSLASEVEHSVTVNNLTPNTEYHYRVCSTAEAEKCSEDRIIITDPIPTVLISSVWVTPSKTSAIISWATDFTANSVVLWGSDASVANREVNDAQVTSHSVNITGLLPKRRYYFKVKSAPIGGEEAVSPLFTFITRSNSGLRSDKFGPP